MIIKVINKKIFLIVFFVKKKKRNRKNNFSSTLAFTNKGPTYNTTYSYGIMTSVNILESLSGG